MSKVVVKQIPLIIFNKSVETSNIYLRREGRHSPPTEISQIAPVLSSLQTAMQDAYAADTCLVCPQPASKDEMSWVWPEQG